MMKKCEMYCDKKGGEKQTWSCAFITPMQCSVLTFWSVECNLQYNKKESEEVLPKDVLPLAIF